MARSIQSFKERMDKTLAKRVEDHKQMMEKSAQRWFMSLVLALLLSLRASVTQNVSQEMVACKPLTDLIGYVFNLFFLLRGSYGKF